MRRRSRSLSLLVGAALIFGFAAPLSAAVAAEADDDEFASLELTNDGWTWEIVIYDGTGKSRRKPIPLPVIGRPDLSPDGTRIVFTSWVTNETDGRWGLFIANIDGSNITKFTTPSGIDRDPEWSPDGRYIAFSRDIVGSTIPSNCCHIRIKAVDRGSHVAVPGTTGGTNPAWSPDGTQLAYQRPSGIRVTDVDGTNSFSLTGANGAEPAWSANGRRIAYVRPNAGLWEIAVRPSDGGTDDLRVRSSRRLEAPQWDPDNSTLYYVRYAGQGYDGRTETAVWRQTGSGDPVRLYKTNRSIVHLAHRAVTLQPVCDFDGDQRSDLAVGIPGDTDGANAGAGAVGVLYSAGSGLAAAGDQLWSQSLSSIKGQPADGNAFGSAVACGDFDADGDADLAVGIPGDGAASGAVTVIQGSSGALTGSGDQRWTQDSTGVLGAVEPDDRFGTALAVGDMNGDGYDDLAIGVPGDRSTKGVVNVLYGGSAGLSSNGDERWHQDVDGIGANSARGNAFGASLAIGDFDHDGYDDLAVGAPGDKKNAGAVTVLYGTDRGLDVAGDQRWHQDVNGIEGSAVDDNAFGSALIAADFDRDGRDDLAIGAPGDTNSKGSVTVLYGAKNGLAKKGEQRWHLDKPGVSGTAKQGNRFGAALTAGDFDGDGYGDLAVGVPGDRGTAGAVAAIYGTSSGLSEDRDQRWHQDNDGVGGGGADDSAYGMALFAADFNDDGYFDLAIGAPGDRNGEGAVVILYGRSGRLNTSNAQWWHQDVGNIEGTGQPGDAFGGAL